MSKPAQSAKKEAEVRETTVGHPLCDSSDHGCETSIAAGTALFPPSSTSPGSLGKSCSLSRDSEAGALDVEDDQGLIAVKVSKPPFGHPSFAIVASPPGFPPALGCGRCEHHSSGSWRQELLWKLCCRPGLCTSAKIGSLSAGELPSCFSLAANSLQLLEEEEKIYRRA